MTSFFEGNEFPIGTRFFLADGRCFYSPDTPNRLSRSVWLYRAIPDDPADSSLYQLRVRRLAGTQPLQEALPPGLDWEPVTVTGIRLQGTEYRLPLGFSFLLAYDTDANIPEEPDWDDNTDWAAEPPSTSEEAEDEETAEQILEELLADIDLCITLLNLELKWMRGDKTVEVAKLAEATAQLDRMTRMKTEYEQALTRQQVMTDMPQSQPAKSHSNLIHFPGQE